MLLFTRNNVTLYSNRSINSIKSIRICFMESLFESLKKYFENTPKEVLDKDWKEVEYLNEIGPDVIEYAEFVRENFGIGLSYSASENLGIHKYDVDVSSDDKGIAADAMYCLAT